jgi:hypothetical protein
MKKKEGVIPFKVNEDLLEVIRAIPTGRSLSGRPSWPPWRTCVPCAAGRGACRPSRRPTGRPLPSTTPSFAAPSATNLSWLVTRTRRGRGERSRGQVDFHNPPAGLEDGGLFVRPRLDAVDAPPCLGGSADPFIRLCQHSPPGRVCPADRRGGRGGGGPYR